MAKFGLGVAAVVVAAGAFIMLRGEAAGAAKPGARWRTADVVTAPVKVVVAATGVVEPAFKVEVKSKASGEVVEFPFEPGDPVEAGKLLARLEPKDENRSVRLRESEVASNRAALAAAEADFGLAEGRMTRAGDLAKQRLISPEELDAATFARARAAASADLARGTLARSEIGLEEARDRLADTRIVAPITGTLLTKAVEKGHIIASGITSISGGTSLATIADLSRIFVLADVDESDVGKVRVGAAARIGADAYRDASFEGRVERIMPLGVEDQNVTVFRVKIEVLSENKKLLLPNMTADVQIHVAEKDAAIVVPSTALRVRDGKSGVEVLAAGKSDPEFRPVTRGLTDGTNTEVEGVALGEKVVVGEEKPEEPRRWSMFGGSRSGTSTGSSTGASTQRR